MKPIQLFLIAALVIPFSACYKTIDRKVTQVIQVPIYQYTTEAEAEAGLKQGAPTQLSSFGNIYSYSNYLLINERGSGVHIYDNTDPTNPTQVSFMNIPGNQNFSIQNNILYADSYDDIVVLDISDINNIRLLNRIDNVFPKNHPSIGIIVGYKDSTIESFEEVRPQFEGQNDDNTNFTPNTGGPVRAANASNQVGIGGSFARFTISNNHLFAIDSRFLNVFDLANPSNPTESSKTAINEVNEIETLFAYETSLFIGTTDGVLIYDISNPASIAYQSIFTHARACDPVYVENDIAYVTLRSNLTNRCTGINNQLDVIDVSNLSDPSLIQTFQMINPHGVGVDDSLLFVCEADHGLKVFETKKTYNGNVLINIELKLIAFKEDIFAYDVIPLKGKLIVVGEQSLHQYDYSNPSKIRLLSKIE